MKRKLYIWESPPGTPHKIYMSDKKKVFGKENCLMVHGSKKINMIRALRLERKGLVEIVSDFEPDYSPLQPLRLEGGFFLFITPFIITRSSVSL